MQFLITHQAHPSYGHETQSTSMARRRPRIEGRVLENVVAWTPEPRFPAAGSRKMSLVRNLGCSLGEEDMLSGSTCFQTKAQDNEGESCNNATRKFHKIKQYVMRPRRNESSGPRLGSCLRAPSLPSASTISASALFSSSGSSVGWSPPRHAFGVTRTRPRAAAAPMRVPRDPPNVSDRVRTLRRCGAPR